jgi:uncharacterized protein YjdB
MEFLKHDKRRILMKKNTFLWITAAVVIAALVLGGCPSPTNDDGSKEVNDPVLTGISVTPATRSLGESTSETLSASPIPATAKLGEITWSSDDTDKVTVNENGEILAVAKTTTPVKVWATSKAKPNIKGFCEVTVTERIVPVSITVMPATKELNINETFTLTATQDPQGAADNIKWTSADTTKVTVNENTGEIRAVASTATAVRITATSVQTPAVSGYCDVTVAEAATKLVMNFVPGPSFSGTPPTLPAKNSDNVYIIDTLFPDGNFATAGGLVDTVIIYPDRVLTGDFKFRARIKITDFNSISSASKGLIVGAFKGAEGPGGFATGPHNTQITAINLRSNGAVRNIQSRSTDAMAATGLNVASIHDKSEEFIYEVIRTTAGIQTSMYVSKTGDKLPNYSNSSPLGWSGGSGDSQAPTHIQATTPAYAGIALVAIKANISQIELWDGDLDGTPVFYTGNSTPEPVAVTSISLEVTGDDDKGSSITGEGTLASPATFSIRWSDVQNFTDESFTLVPKVQPAYADITTGKFYISGSVNHPNDQNVLTINEDTGVVKGLGKGKATVQVISDDPIEATYFLTIRITDDYVPIDDFTITGGKTSLMETFAMRIGTDIGDDISDPLVTWTASPAGVVKFLDGEDEVDTLTDLPPDEIVTVIGKTATATVTITASATTEDNGVPTTKTATKTIAVKAYNTLIWEWNTGDTTTNGYAVINELSFSKGGGTTGSTGTGVDGPEGSLAMTGGARWGLGYPQTPQFVNGTGAGNGVYVRNAELDLSKKYKLTVKFVGKTGTIFSGSLNTYTGGNGTGPVIGDGTAPLVGTNVATANWSNATLFNVSPSGLHTAAELTATDPAVERTIEVTVDPDQTTLHSAVGSAFTMDDVIHNQWIQFRCDSGTSPLWITHIKLEYVP